MEGHNGQDLENVSPCYHHIFKMAHVDNFLLSKWEFNVLLVLLYLFVSGEVKKWSRSLKEANLIIFNVGNFLWVLEVLALFLISIS